MSKYPRVMIAGISSGSGKTMITCGLLHALKKRKLQVSSFKCGPDYIDPMFHSQVIGTKSRNLDPFFTGEEMTRYLFRRNSAGSDISVLEGVMGYYDGIAGTTHLASSYELAEITKTPVILIVNARGLSYSVLAVIKGFLEFRENSHISGVILNQISEGLYKELKPVIEAELPVRVYGYVPIISDCSFESRHLGLITPDEMEGFVQKLDKISDVLEETLDIDSVLALAEANGDLPSEDVPSVCNGFLDNRIKRGSRPRIAVARDRAFCFYYEDNLQLLTEMGAELTYFSPLADTALPEDIHGLLLGGGYPELHALALSSNESMRRSIYTALEQGLPCIAECGGFLYLNESLQDMEGISRPMVGFIRSEGMKKDRLSRFGYIDLTAKRDNMLCLAGEVIKGHEFHYWDGTNNGDGFLAKKPKRNREWECAHVSPSIYAGFPHLYFYSNPEIAWNFVKACLHYSKS